MDLKLSIIIITHNRLELLKKCLESISLSILPLKYEIIVIINGNDEHTLNFFQTFPFPKINFKFYPIDKSSNGTARNEGIKQAQGEILYFLDDDVMVKEDTFSQVISKFDYYHDVDIIGGPNITPIDSKLFQRCSGQALASLFGAANMQYKWAAIGQDRLTDDRALILCNLAARKRMFDRTKVNFNGHLTCAEENLLIQELKLKGHKILYCPQLAVYHERRKSLKELAQQIFKYGKGRAQLTLYLPRSLPLLNVLPSIFVLYVMSLMLFPNSVYVLPFLLYLVIDLLFSVYLSVIQKSAIAFPIFFILFPVEHVSYGLGFLYGVFVKHR